MGGKSGPCTHCGITATPLWRRGPPEKPILCNACGSRWRHRGTLAGYMPMQVTGLSTCHVPTDYVAPDEPVIPRVKSAGSLKRKERGEGDGQEEEKGMGDRLRDQKEKDGYESDSSEALLLGQAARRRMSPSCSPISVLPAPRKRASPPRVSHAWGQMSSLFSDLHNFDLDLSDVLTSAQPFEGLDNDVSLYGAEKAPQKPKSLDAGQYISGLVVRTRVDALGGPGCRNSVKQTLTHAAKPSVLKDGQEPKERGMVPPLPSSARFTLPSRPTAPQPPAHPSWANAAPGLAQLNIAKLQGSDFGNGSPHRASFPENLLFKGASPRVPESGESLNDFMARTRGEKRLGELAGAHDMPGSYDSLDSGASLVLDETREHPTVDLNPPPEGAEKGDKDLNELHRMFSAPIWDSLDADPHAPGGLDKGFQLRGFSVPENGATPLV